MKTYNNHNLLVVVSLATFALTACTDNFEDKVGGNPDNCIVTLGYQNLSADWAEYGVGSDAGEVSNKIYAAGSAWKIDNAADWFSVNPSSGGETGDQGTTVNFAYQENLSANTSRIGLCTARLTGEGLYNYKTDLTLIQNPARAYVRWEDGTPLTWNVGGSSGNEYIDLTFTTNDNWDLYTNRKDWWKWTRIDKDTDNGPGTCTVRILCTPNTGTTTRAFTVSVRCESNGAETPVITIYQAPSSASVVGSSSVSMGADATQTSFTLRADAEWSAAVQGAAWLSVSPSEGLSGETTLTLTATDNNSTDARSGVVSIQMNGVEKCAIKVQQAGRYLNLSPSRMTFERKTSSQDATVESNANWTVTTNQSWITTDKTTGKGSTPLRISVAENTGEKRSGWVRLTIDGTSVSKSIVITQNGQNISFDDKTVLFSDDGGTQTRILTADGDWTANNTADWLTVSPLSGSKGDTKITLTATENMQDDSRSTTVSFNMGDKAVSIYAEQEGKYVKLDETPMLFSSAEGKGEISLSTNETWTVTTTDNTGWIKATPASGENEGKIVVTVTRNNTMTERNADVVITTGSGKKKAIPVKQAVRYLRANATAFTFMAEGGEQGPLNIESDGTYSVSCNDGWLEVKQIASGSYSIVAMPNTEEATRQTEIVVKCIDLSSGVLELHIPVKQVSDVNDLTKDGFSTEAEWNGTSNGDDVGISIKPFGNEENWDNHQDN